MPHRISRQLERFLPREPALRGLLCVLACVDAWVLVGGAVEAFTGGNVTWGYMRPIVDASVMVPLLLLTGLTMKTLEPRLSIPWALAMVVAAWLVTSILIGLGVLLVASRRALELSGEPAYKYESFPALILMALTVALLFVAPGLYARSIATRTRQLDSERRQVLMAKEDVEKEAKERVFHFLHTTVQSQVLLASKRILDLSQDPYAQNIREDLMRLSEDVYSAYSASMRPLLAEGAREQSKRTLGAIVLQAREFAAGHKLAWEPDPHVGLTAMDVKLPEPSAAAVTRALQEALVNVVKHSADNRVIVGTAITQLPFRTSEVVISVSNLCRQDESKKFPSGEGLRFITALLSRIGASVDTSLDRAFFRLRIVLHVYDAFDGSTEGSAPMGSHSVLLAADTARD